MSKDPAVLFYTSDFLIGVSDMPFLERGYYITLLCLQHQKGHLSEKTICFSLGLASVSEIPSVMEKFDVDEEGKYFQHRMEEEAAKRSNYTESRRNNGKKGGRPPNHMDNHMDNHMGNENENENTPVEAEVEILDNGGKEKGVQGEKPRGSKFSPPSVDEVSTYCMERGNRVDAESFCDFYASKGWLVGKTPMKDWKAAVRTWEKRGTTSQGGGQRSGRRDPMDELRDLHDAFSAEEGYR